MARGGRLELDGRSRIAIPANRAAFQKAIQHFVPTCKTVVLREADAFMGMEQDNWRALFSSTARKLEQVGSRVTARARPHSALSLFFSVLQVDVTLISAINDNTLGTMQQAHMRRFQLRSLNALTQDYSYEYMAWFGESNHNWSKLEDWDAPAISFRDRKTLDAVLVPSAKTLRRLCMTVSFSQYDETRQLETDLATMFPKLTRLRIVNKGRFGMAAPMLANLTSLQVDGALDGFSHVAIQALTKLRKVSGGRPFVSRAYGPLDLFRQNPQLESFSSPMDNGLDRLLQVVADAKCTGLRHVLDTHIANDDEPIPLLVDADRMCAQFPRLETLGQLAWNMAETKWTQDKVYDTPTWIRLLQGDEKHEWPKCPNLRMLSCDLGPTGTVPDPLPYTMLQSLDLSDLSLDTAEQQDALLRLLVGLTRLTVVNLSTRDFLVRTDTALIDLVMALPRATRLRLVIVNKLILVDSKVGWATITKEAMSRFGDLPFDFHATVGNADTPWSFRWCMAPASEYVRASNRTWEVEFAWNELIDW
jgi:hypothetical protein